MQYPHILEAQFVADTVTDQEGYQLPTPEPEWVFVSKCRDEPNSSSRQTTNQDGVLITYSSLVQLPRGTDFMEPGTKVRVKQGDYVRLSGEVKRFDKSSLHSRLWV